MSSIAIEPIAELDQKALTLPEKAKAIKVIDQQTYDVAVEELKGIVALRKEIVEHHAPLKAKAHEAHKAICDAEKKLLQPVDLAERTIKSAIGTYESEQRRIEEERQRKIREELERQAAEQIESAAVEAESQGASVEEVAAIIEQPLIVPRVAPAPTFQRAAGVSTSQTFAAEVFDIKALCKAIGEGKVPANYVSPNMTALNQRARADRQALSIPGVRAVPVSNVRVGGR